MRYGVLTALAAAIVLPSAVHTQAALLADPTSITGTGVVRPWGIAVDGSHNLLVANTDSNTIDRFDARHNYLGAFGASVLSSPMSVTAAPNGHTYVLSGGAVVDFDASLNAVGSFAAPGFGISSDAGSNIYVAGGFSADSVIKYSPSGTPLLTLTIADGINLSHPYGVTVDKFGNILVADSGNRRIVTFNALGAYVSAFTIPDPFVWSERIPKQLQVGDNGIIYVSVGDPGFAAFSSDGTLLDSYHGATSGGLDGATGVALDGNTLYGSVRGLGNPANAQILMFAVPEPGSLSVFLVASLVALKRRLRKQPV